VAGIAGTDERDWRTWEWVTPLVTAVGICAIASIPYLLEYTACTPDMAPSSFTYNTWDQNLYLSWTVQGKWGRFFCEDQFTSEATPPILFSSFFWFLGTLARGLHLPPAVLYHAARVLGIFAFCIVLYPFCRAFSGTR
jgi:hypothetical protein